jgi:hypothetical protein
MLRKLDLWLRSLTTFVVVGLAVALLLGWAVPSWSPWLSGGIAFAAGLVAEVVVSMLRR